jgi:hypothetical protein
MMGMDIMSIPLISLRHGTMAQGGALGGLHVKKYLKIDIDVDMDLRHVLMVST